MPAKSKAQFRFMAALAHNSNLKKDKGLSKEVAQEYISNNKGSESYSNLPDKFKKRKFALLK